MASWTVRVTFLRTGSGYTAYTFPHVYPITDPSPGMKATVIEGQRADGSLVIPGGKKSHKITVEGVLHEDDYDYVTISAAMAAMEVAVTTDIGTLTLEYWNGASWVTNWAYTVRRIEEIDWLPSMRTDDQKYRVSFFVIAF